MTDSKERPLMEMESEDLKNKLDFEISFEWSKWNDLIWAIAFAINIFLTICLALSYGIIALDNSEPRTAVIKSGATTVISHANDSARFMGGLFLVLLIAGLLSISWVYVMSRLASRLILASFLIIIITSLLSGLLLCATGYAVGGILFILLSILGIVFFISIRKYIEFAAAILTISCDAVMKLPATVLYSGLLLGVQTILVIFWVMAVVGIATNEATSRLRFQNSFYRMQDCTSYTYSSDYILNPTTTLRCDGRSMCQSCVCKNSIVVQNSVCFSVHMNSYMFVMFLLSLIWTCTVLSNINHCTTAGSVANWWHRESPSKDIVLKNLKRSVTSLLGSICLGSLLVALVRTARVVVQLAFSRLNSRSQDNYLRRYLRCCLDVCLQGLDWLVQYFNKYAFCYVAMYGHSFLESSRAVVALFEGRGWLGLLTDELIDGVLSIGHVVVGSLTMLTAFVYTRIVTMNVVNSTLLNVSAFFVGYLMCCVTMKVISAAVCTVFVCYAESPDIFLSTHPESYRVLSVAWRRFYPSETSTGTGSGSVTGQALTPYETPAPLPLARAGDSSDVDAYHPLPSQEEEGSGRGVKHSYDGTAYLSYSAPYGSPADGIGSTGDSYSGIEFDSSTGTADSVATRHFTGGDEASV